VGDSLTTQQKIHLLVEKVALQEILRYLTLFQDVFKTQLLFAVELGVVELPQVVRETVQHQPPLVGITVRPQQLVGENVLETISKALLRCPLITTTATLLLRLLQQLFLVRLFNLVVAAQDLPLVQDLTVIPAVRVAA
jgi:hypothetical protein